MTSFENLDITGCSTASSRDGRIHAPINERIANPSVSLLIPDNSSLVFEARRLL